MREPSIHIKERDLIKILIEVFPQTTPGRCEYLAEEICRKAKNKSVTTRTIVVPKNDNRNKKAGKIKMADVSDTMLLGKLLNAYRVKANHKGIRKITEQSREWSQLKELTALVLQFNYDFELDRDKGMNRFIKIAMRHINKKSKVGIIGKLINVYDKVIDMYESELELVHDSDPNLTRKLYDKYKALITKHTGIKSVGFDEDEVLIYFYQMKQEAMELGVSPFTFMDAQFDQLEWTGGYPEPTQLVGQKAKQRVFKYKYEADDDKQSKGPDEDLVKKLISIRG